MKGTVKFYQRLRGWGFITGENGQDYFCHHTGIMGDEAFKYLMEGEKVEFDPQPAMEGKKHSLATNIKTDKSTNEVMSGKGS